MGRLVLLSVAVVLAAAPAAARLPVEAFASLPSVRSAVLSPDGRKIALIVNRDGISAVVVQTLGDDHYETLTSTANDHFRINWIRWANNHRVLVSARYPSKGWGGILSMETRLLSLSVDGGDSVHLFQARPRGVARDDFVPSVQTNVIDMLPDDPRHILLGLNLEYGLYGLGVYRIDVETGRRRVVRQERDNFVSWLTDRQHRIRFGGRLSGGEYEFRYLDLADGHWKTAWHFDVFSREAVWPMGFGLDPGTLYVTARHEGRSAVFRVDLADPALARTLVHADPERDVGGHLLYSPTSGEAIGVLDDTGLVVTVWDDAYRRFLRGVEAALAGLTVRFRGTSDDGKRYLVLAGDDRHPPRFYFGDREHKTLTPFAETYPRLAPDELAGKRTIHYSARDGTEIEGFLTLPAGGDAGKVPAIVFPHGGPIYHVDGDFDYWSEFFASRGYAVLQMNFRGSSGYGLEFMRAGLGNWGTTMQDDVEDGARWLIEQGIADPDRICIVGASYGGYAALMGAARSPDLYRCAVSFAGVTDLSALVRMSRFSISNEVLETMIGSDRRRARSPVAHAEEMEIPILLVHGTDDRSVPILHGRRMRDALEDAGANFRYIEQEGGDHALGNQADRLELFRVMEEFLDRWLAEPVRESGA